EEYRKRTEKFERQKLIIHICDEIGLEYIHDENNTEDYRLLLKIGNESEYADATNIRVAMYFVDDIGREICRMITRDFMLQELKSKHTRAEAKKGSELVIKFEKRHIDHNVKYQTCDSIKELLNSRPNFITKVKIQVQNKLTDKTVDVSIEYEKKRIQRGIFILGSYELQMVNRIDYFDYAGS
ncbi:MAG: hypothetical protein J5605_08570, partial [Bacteroidales bacterium]|nr:hypothetical protein [Bacteroidales bacterium]